MNTGQDEGIQLRLDVLTFMPSKLSELAKSISSKCPVFQTSEMSLRYFMWSEDVMLKFPVQVTNTSVSDTASNTAGTNIWAKEAFGADSVDLSIFAP